MLPAFWDKALKQLYLEKLLKKTPTWIGAKKPSKCAKWDLPTTEIKIKTLKKDQIPKELSKVCKRLSKLATRIPKKRKELKTLVNQYNGIYHLRSLQSEFPKMYQLHFILAKGLP